MRSGGRQPGQVVELYECEDRFTVASAGGFGGCGVDASFDLVCWGDTPNANLDDCNGGVDDDSDGQVDENYNCSDTSCDAHPACMISIGSPCTSNADCVAGLGLNGLCETAMPGGYCFVPCDAQNPGNECPTGSICWIDAACVLPCLPGDLCERPNHVCGDFSAAGLSAEPLCHPTCAQSCPVGLTCEPAFDLCI